jgi:chemotaxis family two-component system response regulator Rcp1
LGLKGINNVARFDVAKGIRIAGRAIEILHVEDNAADANLLNQVLKKAGFSNHLSAVSSGEDALNFLNQKSSYVKAPRPDVVLLDLHLPGKDGLTVLNEIRQSANFKNIPIIILTSSESDLDMDWADRLNATHYIVKPFDLAGFNELVKLLRELWFKTFKRHS